MKKFRVLVRWETSVEGFVEVEAETAALAVGLVEDGMDNYWPDIDGQLCDIVSDPKAVDAEEVHEEESREAPTPTPKS